jgi:hypothetical protein
MIFMFQPHCTLRSCAPNQDQVHARKEPALGVAAVKAGTPIFKLGLGDDAGPKGFRFDPVERQRWSGHGVVREQDGNHFNGNVRQVSTIEKAIEQATRVAVVLLHRAAPPPSEPHCQGRTVGRPLT